MENNSSQTLPDSSPKVSEQTPKHHNSKAKTITLIMILFLISIGIAATAIFLNNNKKQAKITDFESCAAAGNPVMESYPARCATSDGRSFTQELTDEEKKKLVPPQELKTYTNPEYGFSISYPAEGQVINAQGQMSPGMCGGAIKRQYMSTYPYILGVDNYFNITAQPFKGTIEKYINSYGGSSLFDVTPIAVSGAEEAVEINKKDNASPEALMKSPFAYTTRIYKQGNNIFTVMLLQNPGNSGGCVPQDNIAVNDVLSTFRFGDSSPSCTPRPSCLDSIPACKLPETSDMCPPTPNPSNPS